MKLSFKFKIATISFAVSAAILTAFGIALFAFVYSSGLERMDRDLRALAEAPLRGGHPDHYWKQFGDSIRFIHGEGTAEHLALLVIGLDERILFQTDNAPAQFALLKRPDLPESVEPSSSPMTRFFLSRHDADGDQRISRSEFPGPKSRFDLHDANNDGFIDGEELIRMPFPAGRPEGRPGGPPPGFGAPPPEFGSSEGPLSPTASRFVSLQTPAANWRIGIFRTPEVTLVAALDMDSFYAEVDHFRNAFMIAVPLGLILLGFMGWFLADRAMKPIAAVAETAEGITARGLDKRIPRVGNDIELARLVDVSNNMLDRLEKSYHQAVRFSADAAHELQTPLTILQGELDNAIQSSETGSSEQQRYSMLLEELRNLKAVVQKLLLLAHADEGRLNISPETVDMSELTQNAAEDMEIMAPELRIECHIEKGILLSADTALLNQAIRNMASNAAKYASEKGTAVFTLAATGKKACFTLANTAPPIPEEDRPLLFERFHRVEKSRTAAGSGLGLSLAREIARAHGGDLTLDPYANGRVSFTLSLPLKQC